MESEGLCRPSGRCRKDLVLSVSYGLVAAAMCTPVMTSFACIIFGDPFFAPYMPQLVKLVLFSAAIHQLCYVGFSTLPFAVGQVQDAGLVFLSSMARAIVATPSESPRSTLAACLWTLGAATALLGGMLVVVGKLRFASIAQYLPVPVVGGYLAYIGFYCGQAGLAMTSGVELVRLGDWWKLWDAGCLAHVAPGVVVAVAIKMVARSAKARTAKAVVIPGVLAVVAVIFYACLYFANATLEEARDEGWVGPKTPPAGGPFAPWRLYRGKSKAAKIVWETLPRIATTWIGMVVVVAFSSSLDVAAIEMELGRPLDYDSELRTVGLGNLASGIFGGYSGSYIFSQTILNMRSKVADRLSGLVVAGVELALVFVIPVAPTSVMPTCAFGGTLLLIALELVDEWLWKARTKFSRSEYAVDVLTFVAIHALGLEAGFATGLVVAAVAFAATHGPSNAFKCESSNTTKSVVVRNFEQRAFLTSAVHKGQIAVLELRGFVFFGAAATLLARFRSVFRLGDGPSLDDGSASWYGRRRRRRDKPRAYSNLISEPPKFAVLDCSDFAGVDATAARACFVPLLRELRDADSSLLFAALEDDVNATLAAHGVSLDPACVFKTLDSALEAAEERLLLVEAATTSLGSPSPPLGGGGGGGGGESSSSEGLERVLSEHLSEDPTLEALSDLGVYFVRTAYAAGSYLFDAGHAPERLFFLVAGVVDLELLDDRRACRRILRVTRGGVCGELNFFLKRPQRFSARCDTPCDVYVLHRKAAAEMRAKHPDLFVLVQTALLKTLCLQVEDSIGSAVHATLLHH
ncbi:hypothetical protein CTAYLR_004589 [Chrysophaeum taylorii]|uniref:Sulfate transporter n=1 Tax=Chrysophaeum taylorii TaxID=2483200 RepID=A0AAD7XLQ9_9STRA|nr:hypothetical protein CTAYLR_004589 [Chrysophaeum taylorii]